MCIKICCLQGHCHCCIPRYQRYRGTKEVFDPHLKIVFATEQAAFRHGVSRDWSNVEILNSIFPLRNFKGYQIIN